MIVWELCFSLFYFSERGKTGFVSRHRYFLRRPHSPPDATCLRRQRVSLPSGPASRGPWEPAGTVGATAWRGWQAPAPGWPVEGARRTLILPPAPSPTRSVLPPALPGTLFSPFFCWPWCWQELADRVGAACSRHATEKCPKTPLLPRPQTATFVSYDFPPLLKDVIWGRVSEGGHRTLRCPHEPAGAARPQNVLCLRWTTQQGAHRLAREARWPPMSGPSLPTEQCPAGQRDLFPTVA